APQFHSQGRLPVAFPCYGRRRPLALLNETKESGIVHEPVLVRSILEYEQAFGEADDTGDIIIEQHPDTAVYSAENKKNDMPYTPGLMHPSISNFFSNGGGSCYIISLGTYQAFNDIVKASDVTSEISAIEEAIKQADTATLILPTDLMRFGAANYYAWGTELINFCQTEKKYFTIMDVIQSKPTSPTFEEKDISDYREHVKPDSPCYAGAYFPYLNSLSTYAYKDDYSNVYLNGSKLSIAEITNELKEFLLTNYINMPPSPFIAGLYGRLDNASGVWTPPANVSPAGVTGPVVQLTSKQQENLNVDATTGISVNAIRSFTGKGTLVWGARTNDGNSLDWRYINVRRLIISMETDINMALESYVFKPNSYNTWVEVKTMIESYLLGLFNDGAFAGSTADTCYNVLIGVGETMTDEDVLNGNMKVSVQIAPVRPAEFITLTFSQMVAM
ncbi:MAG: phage tail sheath family protein, partial [Flavobacteriales bacterium]|nr:phage tail sheath family protein [Flavobacteriales bacterium]